MAKGEISMGFLKRKHYTIATIIVLLCGTVAFSWYRSLPLEVGFPLLHSGKAPELDDTVGMLGRRMEAQEATRSSINAFTGFRFEDVEPESGITFPGYSIETIFYDHGAGISLADVDGDNLVDVLFVGQYGGNQLYKNLGDLRFRNITGAAGVAMESSVNVGASFVDIDGDRDADLLVSTIRNGVYIFRNDGKGHFKDETRTSELGKITEHASGLVSFDYDRDGTLDLLVTTIGHFTEEEKNIHGIYLTYKEDAPIYHLPERKERTRLFKNDGDGTYTEVTDQMGIPTTVWSGEATFVDFDEDGYPEPVILSMYGDTTYLVDGEGASFANTTASVLGQTPWGAMGVAVLDFENDGDQDLYITDMHSDMLRGLPPREEKTKSRSTQLDFETGVQHIFGNAFYRTNAAGVLQEVSDSIGAEMYWPWGPSIGDINADGYEDAFVTGGMGMWFRYGINSLLINDEGKRFADAEFLTGIEPRREGKYLSPIKKDQALSSRSSAVADLDNDGDLDIVTNEFNGPPQVLKSNLSEVTDVHFLKVTLQGIESNPDGLGAFVTVSAGGKSYTRYVNGKSGYLSQSRIPLYFGLDTAIQADSVTVQWPSGLTQRIIESVPLNGTLLITEGE